MDVYIVSVGVNKTNEKNDGLMSPIFSDQKFEFLPIMEGRSTKKTKRYCDLKSFYSKSSNLYEYIPQECWEEHIHLDPNFDYYLYGDIPTVRGHNLYNIKNGDIILFITSLVQYKMNRYNRSKRNFYFIGEIEVEKFWKFPNKLEKEDISILSHHAHIIREIGNNSNRRKIESNFIAIKGTKNSKRYYRAVPLTKIVCEKYLRDKNDNKFNWFGHPNQVIGSYTRTVRAFFNLDNSEHRKRWGGLKKHIENNRE